MKKHIVIIGCGFGGIEALRRLSRHPELFQITVIDKKTTFDFLPLLPDMVGRDIPGDLLTLDISEECRRCRAEFRHEEVVALDLERRTIRTTQSEIKYDQLIIACGAETNFYGNTTLAQNAAVLRTVSETLTLKKILSEQTYDHYFTAGGGYTGIEIATHLIRWLKRQGKSAAVHIVERADSLLGPLPSWIKNYTQKQLDQMGVQVHLGTTVQSLEKHNLILSDQSQHANALLVWVAGVKMPAFVESLEAEKIQGRLKVNPFMQIRDNVYAIGDCAAFVDHDKPLRMAVMFAMGQGKCAAQNIVRSNSQRPLKAYHAMDLGYVIPTANNRASGIVLGISSKGILPCLLHYGLCAYRSYGWRNQSGVFTHSIKSW